MVDYTGMYEIYFGFSVRYVGGGNRPNARGSSGLPGRTSAASVDDLHDDDARSTAASSYVSSHMSARPVHIAPVAKDVAAVRRATFEISRESSKESSNSESDEQLEQQPRGGREQVRSHPSQSSLSSEASRLSRATTPPPLPPAHLEAQVVSEQTPAVLRHQVDHRVAIFIRLVGLIKVGFSG